MHFKMHEYCFDICVYMYKRTNSFDIYMYVCMYEYIYIYMTHTHTRTYIHTPRILFQQTACIPHTTRA